MKKYLSLILASSMILQSLSMVQATEVVGNMEESSIVAVSNQQDTTTVQEVISQQGEPPVKEASDYPQTQSIQSELPVSNISAEVQSTYSSNVYPITGTTVNYPSQEQIAKLYADYNISTAKTYTTTYATTPSLTSPYASGTLSTETINHALNTLNFTRYIAGLDYDVTSNASYATLAQDASLLMAMNQEMTHYPVTPTGMTDDNSLVVSGKKGAKESNISASYAYSSSSTRNMYETIVNGWMKDDSASNLETVGHRRWCLYPSLGQTGFGSVDISDGVKYPCQRYSAMYAFDYSNTAASFTGVTWPAQNMPTDLFGTTFPWSYSAGKEITGDVQVKLTRLNDEKVWTFDKTDTSTDGTGEYFTVENSNYGQKGCVIFRPIKTDITYNHGDVFHVEITGGVTASYCVSFFDISQVTASTGNLTPASTPSSYTYGTVTTTPVSTVTLNKTTLALDLNGTTTETLTATVLPDTATNKTVSWTSSNPSVATVGASTGAVTANATGTATITATADGKTATCTVTVTDTSSSKEIYTVTFNTDGGSSVASQEVTSGETATQPSSPTKANHSFTGWYTDNTFTTAYNFASPITGATTIYAKWTAILEPEVDDGTGDTESNNADMNYAQLHRELSAGQFELFSHHTDAENETTLPASYGTNGSYRIVVRTANNKATVTSTNNHVTITSQTFSSGGSSSGGSSSIAEVDTGYTLYYLDFDIDAIETTIPWTITAEDGTSKEYSLNITVSQYHSPQVDWITTERGDGEVTISWGDIYNGGDDSTFAELRVYKYVTNTNGANQWDTVEWVETFRLPNLLESSQVVDGLTNGTTYQFRLYVENSVSNSSWIYDVTPLAPGTNAELQNFLLYTLNDEDFFEYIGHYNADNNEILLAKDYSVGDTFRIKIYTDDLDATVATSSGTLTEQTENTWDYNLKEWVYKTVYYLDFDLKDVDTEIKWSITSPDGTVTKDYSAILSISDQYSAPKAPTVTAVGEEGKITVSWGDLDDGGDMNASYSMNVLQLTVNENGWYDEQWIEEIEITEAGSKSYEELESGTIYRFILNVYNCVDSNSTIATAVAEDTGTSAELLYVEVYKDSGSGTYHWLANSYVDHGTTLVSSDFNVGNAFRFTVIPTDENATVENTSATVTSALEWVWNEIENKYAERTVYYLDFDLTDTNTKITWDIVSKDKTVTKSYSSTVSISGYSKPTIEGLSAVAGNEQVTLNWTSHTGGDSNAKLFLNVYFAFTDSSGAEQWDNVKYYALDNTTNTLVVDNLKNGTNYLFELHYSNAVGNTYYDITATPVAPTVTPTPPTTPSSTYTITLYANGGSLSTNSLTTGTDGRLSSLPTPTRSSYTFDGWYTASSGGSRVTTSTVFDSDATLYAQWTYVGSSSSGGSSSGGSSSGGSSSDSSSSDSSSSGGSNTTTDDTTTDDTTTDDTTTDDTSTDDTTTDDTTTEDSTTDNNGSTGNVTIDLPVVNTMTTNSFSDLNTTAWYYEPVKYVYERGLMSGTGNGNFAPEMSMNRGMIVQVLYNVAGQPAVGNSNFADVASDAWFAKAVAWASSVGVAGGTGNGNFSPDGDMTREQLVVMLYGFEKLMNGESYTGSTDLSFNDTANISSWAVEATAWAVSKGVVAGKSSGGFDPQATATRAEVAQILSNFVEMYS